MAALIDRAKTLEANLEGVLASVGRIILRKRSGKDEEVAALLVCCRPHPTPNMYVLFHAQVMECQADGHQSVQGALCM